MMIILPSLVLLLATQPPAPIVAARDAKAKVEAAQQKNSDALGQNPPAQPAGSAPPATAPAQQQPSPLTAGQAPTSGTTATAAAAGYGYDPAGRRDPFVSLLTHGAEGTPAGATRSAGLPGALVGELSVKGILKTGSTYTALLQGPDRKTYVAHAGDRVMDGTIKSITQDAVVFSQEVTDPLSLVKQREVRKTIRPEIR